MTRFHFNEQLILFGISEGMVTDKGMDFIILFAKFYIYKCKLNKVLPSVVAFLESLVLRWKMERYVFAIQCRNVEFAQDWLPYQQMLE